MLFQYSAGTLPESPPDSGSEPPYSPADLHAINNLNQIVYHQQHPYLTQQHTTNQHHLDQTMHANDTSNVNCHITGTSNGTNHSTPSSSIHKTEDILLSSTAAMHLPNSVSNMMLSGAGAGAGDIMMHQNVSGTAKNRIESNYLDRSTHRDPSKTLFSSIEQSFLGLGAQQSIHVGRSNVSKCYAMLYTALALE